MDGAIVAKRTDETSTRAKTDLKAAAVDVGPGQLRFGSGKVERFIEARRRGLQIYDPGMTRKPADEAEDDEAKALPLWRQYVVNADDDVLAFAVLYEGRLMKHAFYFGTQAIEKYLKALALSIIEREGGDTSPKANPWLTNHPLVSLANHCAKVRPFYTELETRRILNRFSEYDITARYPRPKWKFTTEDRPILERLLREIRKDLPIELDVFPLALALVYTRGVPTDTFLPAGAVEVMRNMMTRTWAPGGLALRRVFDDPESLLHKTPDQDGS
jgi:hypothetical protein